MQVVIHISIDAIANDFRPVVCECAYVLYVYVGVFVFSVYFYPKMVNYIRSFAVHYLPRLRKHIVNYKLIIQPMQL